MTTQMGPAAMMQEEGYDAAMAGAKPEDCPYDDDLAIKWWNYGYKLAMRDKKTNAKSKRKDRSN